tara:strand:+ start:1051 stop:4029 length:2979 start_codon:yes stop_codon:yes gene_type:complete
MSTLEDLSNGLVQLNFQREALIDSGDAEGANLVTQKMTVLATELEKVQGQSIPEPKEVSAVDQLNAIDLDIKPRPQQMSPLASPMATGGTPLVNLELPDYEAEKQKIAEALPDYLGVSPEEIDLTKSLGAKRMLLSFASQDEQAKALVKDYGIDNVRFVPVGKKMKAMVRGEDTGNKFIFVDEVGPNLKDVLDLTGGAVEVLPEIGLSIYAPQVKAAKGVGTITKAAIGAFTGRVLGSATRDFVAGGFVEGEKKFTDILGQALAEGGESAAYELLFGKTFQYAGRMFDQGPLKISPDADLAPIQKAINDIEKTFPGAKLPRTPGLMSDFSEGLKSEVKNVARYSDGVINTIAKRAEKARDTLYEVAATIKGKPTAPFKDQYASWAKGYKEAYEANLKEIAASDPILAKQMEIILEKRLKNFGYGNITDDSTTAAIIRDGSDSSTKLRVENSNEFYKTWLREADASGVNPNPKVVQSRLNKVINGLNLPKDLEGNLINVFTPSKVRRVQSQSGALTRSVDPPTILDANGRVIPLKESTEPNVSNLNLEQIDNWRKDLGDFYGEALKNRPREAAKIKKIVDELDSIIDDLSEQGGQNVLDARNAAKNYFVEEVLPTRNPAIKKLLELKPDKSFKMSDFQVVNSFFRGPKAVANLKDLKKVLGPEQFEKIKDGYVNYVTKSSTNINGDIDFLKLKVEFNDDVVKELFGKEGVKRFNELKRLYQFSKTASLDAGQLEKLLRSPPQELKGVLNEIKAQQFRKVAADNFVKNTLLKKVAKGKKIDFSTPEEFLSTFKTLTGKEARDVLEAMPQELRQSFRQEFIADIYYTASRDFGGKTLQKTSRALGRETIWDVNSMDKLLGDKVWRERAEAVVGKNTLNQISNVNNSLKAYQKASLGKSDIQINAIAADAGKNLNFYGTNTLSFVYNRVFAAAHASESFAKVFSKTKDVPKALNLLLPTMLASKEGLKALQIEADKDPRFKTWLLENLPKTLSKVK